MDSENTVTKPAMKKKVKNKEWGVSALSNQEKNEILKSIPASIKMSKKYKKIAQMAQKYTFSLQAILGTGFASTVYLGVKNGSNEQVCIKAIDLLSLGVSSSNVELIHKQIQCLLLFNSDYIVKLYDVYESNTFIYLVMQLCPGGDLYKLLKLSPNNLPSKFITTLIRQIGSGLREIHDKGIIHRDLKTQNIFILKFPQNEHEQIKVKIGDLGFCIAIKQLQKLKQMGKIPHNLGSPIYMSIQVSQRIDYSFASDIYALGVIWYELYHKKAPWQAKSEQQLIDKKLNIVPEKWRQDIQPQIKQMIKRCISNDCEKRPTCSEILQLIKNLQQKQHSKQ